jgi:hypothetical protein
MDGGLPALPYPRLGGTDRPALSADSHSCCGLVEPLDASTAAESQTGTNTALEELSLVVSAAPVIEPSGCNSQ